jgi:urease accessory protein
MNLALLQLGDSALPIGGYSHSWGLEAAVHRGLVRDPAGLEGWVRRWLRHAVGPLDAVAVAGACRAAAEGDWGQLRHANDLLWASLAAPTLRHASRDMGEQLLALAGPWPWAVAAVGGLESATPGAGPAEWHHACVFGALAHCAGAAPAEAARVYLHQAALGAIGAGVRCIPIGHSHGQLALARLHGEITAQADLAARTPLDQVGSFCPAYEVLCHAQGRLYTRLFRS